MIGEWKVKINDFDTFDSVKLYIYRTKPGNSESGTEILGSNGIVSTISRGDQLMPTLEVAREMLPAIMEALIVYGTKPKDQGKTEGQLEAQTEHLQDLRKLLKLKI